MGEGEIQELQVQENEGSLLAKKPDESETFLV